MSKELDSLIIFSHYYKLVSKVFLIEYINWLIVIKFSLSNWLGTDKANCGALKIWIKVVFQLLGRMKYHIKEKLGGVSLIHNKPSPN